MTKETISGETKQKICEDLQVYIETISGGSQNKASKLLKISSATISNMLNTKWENIADEMWRTIQKQVGHLSDSDWKVVATNPYNFMWNLFEDASNYSNTFGIIASEGCGKDETMRAYAKGRNFFKVDCSDYFNRNVFLKKVLESMGVNTGSFNAAEMVEEIQSRIRKMDRPVIALNEADKLSDSVLYFFISFYNLLEGECGLILIATSYLERKIMRGVIGNRKGFREIYSRMGRNFMRVPSPTEEDVDMICRANGVTDEFVIKKIYNEDRVTTDLRRVKRVIHATKQKGGEI